MTDLHRYAPAVLAAIALAATPAATQTRDAVLHTRYTFLRDGGTAAGIPPAAETVAARVDSLVRTRLAEGVASMSVAIVRGGDTLVHRAWGSADVAAARAATEGSTYRIGSISKQFTAALLLRLVDRGRLSLGDTLGHHLTGLRPEWRPLTIEQVLNHTSGLQREFRQASRRTEDLPGDTLLAMATRGEMAFAPGTGYGYSNTGYMILGVLVERLYGTPYGAALRDEIARPLGLPSLGWCGDPEKAATEVAGHQRSDGGELGTAVFIHIAHSLGAGGICASAGDLAAWNRALHGGGVLSPESYAAMTTPRGAAVEAGYGFGLRLQPTPWGTTVLEHSGATPGFVAENAWYPAESLSVTVLYNTTPPPADGLSETLARIALGLP
jgi:D-alanyl-D-alanine carboxypeptidase